MNDSVYKRSFSLFLEKTDEKNVIKKFIYQNIPINCQTDFLDIGGGDGSLALEFSDKVKSTLIIEPNDYFYSRLIREEKINVLKKKWEDTSLDQSFDFILAAYVVTYFSPDQREYLIEKMYNLLSQGGHLLILSVDAKKGSWRRIHSYFYKLISHRHQSSDQAMKKIAQKYNVISKSFKTYVVAKDSSEMIEILRFDFSKYNNQFTHYSKHLLKYLKKFSDENGKIILEMVHNAFIIVKK